VRFARTRRECRCLSLCLVATLLVQCIQITEGGLRGNKAHVETAKVDNEMVTKRRPQATEESSPRRSFNSIEFYSGVQLISLRSPLKSSLSSVAYCFTLRLPGRAYIRTFLFHIRTRTSKRPEGERARGSVAGHRQRNSSGLILKRCYFSMKSIIVLINRIHGMQKLAADAISATYHPAEHN